MKLLFFSVILLTSLSISHAQFSPNYLIKTNGEKINYRKFNYEKHTVTLKIPGKKGKTLIDIDSVYSCYSTEENLMYYPMPVVRGNRFVSTYF